MYQATATSHARENTEMTNEMEKLKLRLGVEQSQERMLKLRLEATESEMSLVETQLESNKAQIDEAKAEGEDLYIDLRDKMSF